VDQYQPPLTLDESIALAAVNCPADKFLIKVRSAVKQHVAHHMCEAYVKARGDNERSLITELFKSIFNLSEARLRPEHFANEIEPSQLQKEAL
jgi:hypothetical protein